jgi:hypothetical protein
MPKSLLDELELRPASPEDVDLSAWRITNPRLLSGHGVQLGDDISRLLSSSPSLAALWDQPVPGDPDSFLTPDQLAVLKLRELMRGTDKEPVERNHDGNTIARTAATPLPVDASTDDLQAVATGEDSRDAQTQPSTQPTIRAFVFGGRLFQIIFGGLVKPRFFQTVAISGTPLTDAMRQKETSDHGGQDPFDGPVPDNPTGDPTQPFAEQKTVGGWRMQDGPAFPEPYPSNFAGTKTFVTTVEDAQWHALKTIHWHATRDADGRIDVAIDSQ